MASESMIERVARVGRLEMPDACPSCGAVKTDERNIMANLWAWDLVYRWPSEQMTLRSVEYACGAALTISYLDPFDPLLRRTIDKGCTGVLREWSATVSKP